MTGPSTVLVNTFSATHGHPDDAKNHRVYPIDRGHSDLVKFSSSHDEAYRTLVAYLKGIDYSKIGDYPFGDSYKSLVDVDRVTGWVVGGASWSVNSILRIALVSNISIRLSSVSRLS